MNPRIGARRATASVLTTSSSTLAHRVFSLKRDPFRLVHQPVKDAVGERGILHGAVPPLHWLLPGKHCGCPALPVLYKLNEIFLLTLCEHGVREVVYDEQRAPVEVANGRAALVGTPILGEILEQVRNAVVPSTMALQACANPECAGKVGFPAPVGPVMMTPLFSLSPLHSHSFDTTVFERPRAFLKSRPSSDAVGSPKQGRLNLRFIALHSRSRDSRSTIIPCRSSKVASL